jgi:regulator of replication initiation timing
MATRIVTIQDLKNRSPQEVVKTVLKRKRFSVGYIKNVIKQVLPDVEIDAKEIEKYRNCKETNEIYNQGVHLLSSLMDNISKQNEDRDEEELKDLRLIMTYILCLNTKAEIFEKLIMLLNTKIGALQEENSFLRNQNNELKEEVNKFQQQFNTPVTQYEEYKPVDITITTKQRKLSPDDIITMFQSNFNKMSLPSSDERKKKIPSHKIGLNPKSSNVYVRESSSGETEVHVKSMRKSYE